MFGIFGHIGHIASYKPKQNKAWAMGTRRLIDCLSLFYTLLASVSVCCRYTKYIDSDFETWQIKISTGRKAADTMIVFA